MFRISGNIRLNNNNSFDDFDRSNKLNLKIGKENLNNLSFLQYLQPLSARNPYFFVHILNISKFKLE